MLKLPAAQYRWQGLDGSEILSLRPSTGWYGTQEGTAVHSVSRGVEEARKTGLDTLVLWGLGDHGGGATRKDLDMIATLQRETTDVEIRHSTPEAYAASLKSLKTYPLQEGDLQRCFSGCYISISTTKRALRRGEALLRSAEAWSALAWWLNGKAYPRAELEIAWKGVLFNTFHDILPGSTLEAALSDVNEKFGRSADICRQVRLASQLALLPNVAPKKDTLPLYVFNPHASTLRAPVGLEFLIDSMPAGRKPFALYDNNGKKLPMQDAGGGWGQSAGAWQRHLAFIAEIPALSVRRYEIRKSTQPAASRSPLTVQENKTQIVVENRWVKAKFLRATGGIASLVDKKSGRDLLKGSIRPVAMKDDLDAWGGEAPRSFSQRLGDFVPLAPNDIKLWAGNGKDETPALCVLHQGSVKVTVQSLVGWKRSRIGQQFTLYADSPYLDVSLRVHWQERRQCLKWLLPLRLNDAQTVCEVPFAAIERPMDGIENVGGRWVRMEEKRGDGLAVGIANDGQYSFHAKQNGELGLGLLRGAVHCFFGGADVSAGQQHTYMDQGQHDFRFRIIWGKADSVEKQLVPAAMNLNSPLEPFVIFNHPVLNPDAPEKTESPLEITPNTVVLAALKKSDKGNALILRFNETLGKQTKASLKLAGRKQAIKLDFHPFEIKTLRLSRTKQGLKVSFCNLLEE